MDKRAIQSAQRESRWRVALERFGRSGLSVTQFCRRERLSVPSFYYWRARFRGDDKPVPTTAPARFIDLGLLQAKAKPGDAPAVEIKLELGAGIVLRIRRG